MEDDPRDELAELEDHLTERQRTFVREYLSNGGNATKAAMVMTGTDNRASACSEGYRVLRTVEVRAYIEAWRRAHPILVEDIIAAVKHEQQEAPQARDRLKASELLAKLGGHLEKKVTVNVTTGPGALDEAVRGALGAPAVPKLTIPTTVDDAGDEPEE